MMMKWLRRRAGYRLASIPCAPLDELFQDLTVFHDEASDFACLTSKAANLFLGAGSRSVLAALIDGQREANESIRGAWGECTDVREHVLDGDARDEVERRLLDSEAKGHPWWRVSTH
jgi:hypothetical protein